MTRSAADRLLALEANHRLGLLTPPEVAAAARVLSSELPYNEPLSELARSKAPTGVATLLTHALEDERLDGGTIDDAVARSVWETCNKILAGDVMAIDGARQIWRVARRLPDLGELAHFIALASEWDDDPAHRSHYEAEIRLEAARVVDGTS